MKMQFFTIPAHGDQDATDAVNNFLAQHRVSSVRSHFVADGAQSFWAIRVTYVEREPRAKAAPAGRGQIDYRQVLSAEDFAVYARLREVRKRLAGEHGVPPYQILTNEQLADIVQRRLHTRAELEALSGFGEARLRKYGQALLAAFTEAFA